MSRPSSDSDSSSTDYHHPMHNFDLNVVHDALQNPNGSEFHDHFGFRIHVQTDDEYDEDTSDDNETLQHGDEKAKNSENSSSPSPDTIAQDAVLAVSSSTTSSSSMSSSSDTYTATNTAITTPTTAKTHHLSLLSMVSQETPLHSKETRRGRSFTLDHPTTTSPSRKSSSYRPRAATLTTLSTTFQDCLTGDTSINAADSCPTTDRQIPFQMNSDEAPPSSPSPMAKPHQDRPSDLFRNRQSRHISSTSIPHSATPSACHTNLSAQLDQLKESSTDIHDWEFWATTIKKAGSVNPDDLRNHLCIGIPPSLRGLLWQVFSHQTKNDARESMYRELLKETSPHEKVIQRDLARTFPTHTFFRERNGQEMLFDVLRAYSLYDPQVGYCQGLPFVVGCLLLQMPEETAFCVLIDLMNNYGLRGHYTPKMELLHERMFQFDDLLKSHQPIIHRHLEAQGVRPTMYASQWFMTLFAYRCPLESVFCVLDMVFTQGTCVILNVALALMQKNQSTLLSLEFEGLLRFLGSDIFDAYQDGVNDLVKDALAFTIDARHLTKLSKRYQIKASQEAKRLEKEDHLRTEHYDLSRRAKELALSYDTLNKEHQGLARQVIESKLAMASAYDTHQQLRHAIAHLEQRLRTPTTEDTDPTFHRLALENAQLVQRNAQLEDHLAEVESTLIEFKMKYAQSESDYEQMKNTLGQIKKISRSA